jgi:hypothetical protein
MLEQLEGGGGLRDKPEWENILEPRTTGGRVEGGMGREAAKQP